MGSARTVAGSVGESLIIARLDAGRIEALGVERSAEVRFRQSMRRSLGHPMASSKRDRSYPKRGQKPAACLRRATRGLHEVIVVDGFSTDGHPGGRPLAAHPTSRSSSKSERARETLFVAASKPRSGDILVMLDADGSADPAEIPAFVEALIKGADFAKGTRFHKDGGSSDITPLRSAGNRVLSGTVNLLFGTAYSDLCYGYNAFWRHCLPAMNVDCTGFEVETLINIRVARAGLKVREVPSFERDRIYGQSNLNTFRDGGRVLRTILRERIRRMPRVRGEQPNSRDAMSVEAAS